MKPLLKSLVIWFAPYFVSVFYLIWRGPQFIAGMARWVWWVALCYFFVGLIIVEVTSGRRKTIAAATRKEAPANTTTRALKGGLILYILIFLNGAGLAIRGRIPFWFAVPGLTVDALLIALFLWLLTRQRSKAGSEN
jgi:hypothetical protein